MLQPAEFVRISYCYDLRPTKIRSSTEKTITLKLESLFYGVERRERVSFTAATSRAAGSFKRLLSGFGLILIKEEISSL